MHTAPATDPLRQHRAVMRAAGPQALADITDLSPEDLKLIDDYLDRNAPVSAAVIAAIGTGSVIRDEAALYRLAGIVQDA